MSLAESVREVVDETARSHGATRVPAVCLKIGRPARVELDAMRFAFDVVKRGSLADTARLAIVEDDRSAWCMACSQAVAIVRRGDACPRCQSYPLQINVGDRVPRQRPRAPWRCSANLRCSRRLCDEELARMRRNFNGFDPSCHIARSNFVHRVAPWWTPRHLALHRHASVGEPSARGPRSDSDQVAASRTGP